MSDSHLGRFSRTERVLLLTDPIKFGVPKRRQTSGSSPILKGSPKVRKGHLPVVHYLVRWPNKDQKEEFTVQLIYRPQRNHYHATDLAGNRTVLDAVL